MPDASRMSANASILHRQQRPVVHLGVTCYTQDHQINEPKWDAWKVLPEAVRTGQVAFALAHGGLDMHEVRMPVMQQQVPCEPTLWPCENRLSI
jgi:hypothetical protein